MHALSFQLDCSGELHRSAIFVSLSGFLFVFMYWLRKILKKAHGMSLLNLNVEVCIILHDVNR